MSVAVDRRVVITGLGVVAPNGIGRDQFWEQTVNQVCAIGPICSFDPSPYRAQVAGQVKDFHAADFVPAKIIKQTDRCTHMAIAACELARQDAALEVSREPEEIGMYFANQFGGMGFAEPELYAQLFIGPARVSAYQAIAWFYAASQGQWSILTGIRGHGKSIVADRVGGLHALSWAALSIRRGHCSVAFAGGLEAPLTPYCLLIHQSSGLLSNERSDPQSAYRPFDRERKGLVLAEASAMLVLEELVHARQRGAHIYAELAGYAMSRTESRADQDASQYRTCLRSAVERAGLRTDEIDHVLPEGTATPDGDPVEAEAITTLLAHHPTVSVPKSLTGHAVSAAGALDAIWACLMMHHGKVAPSSPSTCPDPVLALNHVTRPCERQINAVLCCGRGSGGLNGGVVLRRWSN